MTETPPQQPHEDEVEIEPRPSRTPSRNWIRWFGTPLLLAAVAYFVDVEEVWMRLRSLQVIWLLIALGLTVPMYVLLATRWHFTAHRIGADLRFRDALADYYLSTFLNQVLPVGIAGDAARALRHRARLSTPDEKGEIGPPVRAVLIERLSGQIALGFTLCVTAALWYAQGYESVAPIGLAAAGLMVVIGITAFLARRRRVGGAVIERFLADAKKALLVGRAPVIQLSISSALIGLHVGVFYCAARASGVDLDFIQTMQVVPLVLGATTLPLAFAGWGVREAAVAGLYSLLGLSSAAGVTVGVTAGVLYLVASSPALIVLLMANPTRTDLPQRDHHKIDIRSLVQALWLGGAAVVSAVTGDVTVFAVAALIAFGVAILWPIAAWTPAGYFGLANTLTVMRILIVAGLGFAFVALSPWEFFGLVIAIWAFDGVDGWLARKTGSASEFGANLDMETDAFYIMMLTLILAGNGIVGEWVLIAGLWRYFYAGTVALFPSRGEAPRSQFARSVFGLLAWSLALAFLPYPSLSTPIAAIGTILVSISFIRGLSWSLRGRGVFERAIGATPPAKG